MGTGMLGWAGGSGRQAWLIDSGGLDWVGAGLLGHAGCGWFMQGRNEGCLAERGGHDSAEECSFSRPKEP